MLLKFFDLRQHNMPSQKKIQITPYRENWKINTKFFNEKSYLYWYATHINESGKMTYPTV